VLAAGAFPAPGASQLPAYLLDENTEVRSIRFSFLDSETFSGSRLMDLIGLTERGRMYGLSSSLAFLPFISKPEPHPFDPLNLQRDVVRIREFYRGAGFPEAGVRYEVELDQASNLVDVEFLIHEGRPRTLASVDYTSSSGTSLTELLAPEVVPGWLRFVEEESTQLGRYFGDMDRARLEGNPLRWLRDQGYPFPTAASSLEVDSTGFQARFTIRIDPGPRSRIGAITVDGAPSVDEVVVLRELPIRLGDWFSASQVSEGRRRISALDLFTVALADVVRLDGPDSLVGIQFRAREAKPRSVTGSLGYTNVGGVTVGGEWQHRNYLGGARTLAVNGTAETGRLAVLNETADRYFRGAVSLRQPFIFMSGLSLVASPFGEYRDDYRDRSWEAGMDGTLVYQFAPLRAVSLRSRVSNRNVLEYRLEDASLGTTVLLPSATSTDSLAGRIVVSALTLSATIEQLDDPVNPKRGFVLQPSLEVTAPLGFPTNEYFKAEVWGSLYRPLPGGLRIAGSLRAGRLLPFGKSVPSAGSNGILEFLQLRDVNLTAGGPSDVRGWSSRMLGPKVPDVQTRTEGDTLTYFASRYLPLGGFARMSGALELQFPVPLFVGGLEGHIFLDGGRVWTPDGRYLGRYDPHDQDRAFFSAGGGLGFETAVGPIRVSAGYKLNPSPLDLRDASDVLDQLARGESILDAPIRKWRRIQLHLTVGRVF
jgi:outer membrane protein insertion porin family